MSGTRHNTILGSRGINTPHFPNTTYQCLFIQKRPKKYSLYWPAISKAGNSCLGRGVCQCFSLTFHSFLIIWLVHVITFGSSGPIGWKQFVLTRNSLGWKQLLCSVLIYISPSLPVGGASAAHSEAEQGAAAGHPGRARWRYEWLPLVPWRHVTQYLRLRTHSRRAIVISDGLSMCCSHWMDQT